MTSPFLFLRTLLLAALAAAAGCTATGKPQEHGGDSTRARGAAPRLGETPTRGSRRERAATHDAGLRLEVTSRGRGYRLKRGALSQRSPVALRRVGVERTAELRRAALRPNAPSSVHEQLGERFAAAGLQSLAVTSLRRAALLCRDPVSRGRISRKVAQTASREGHPRALRLAALADLDAGALRQAEQRLHSARRAAPDPALDYRLLRDLHQCRGDQTAALAAALLAREHANEARTAPPPTPEELARPTASLASAPR